MTLDRVVGGSGGMSQSLEERFLFFLLLLRQPRLRMVYVTSQPINPLIVDYYLSLLPGVIPSHARSRLSLVSVDDSGPESLIEKVLARPRVIARIRDARSRTARCRTSSRTPRRPSNATSRCCSASPCTAPTHGCSRSAPRPGAGGSSRGRGSATRRASRTCTRATTWRTALVALRAQRPDIRAAMVKLNEGVSGSGNAVVELADLPAPGTPAGAGGGGGAGRRHGAGGHQAATSTPTSRSSPSAAASSRNGSSATSCAARACRCG